MSGLRNTMAGDLAKLIGQLPVYCGFSAGSQTVECAWRTQRDEIRFSAAAGTLGETPHEIIVEQSRLGRKPEPKDIFWVSGHRYKITSVTEIDVVSYVLDLERSDH